MVEGANAAANTDGGADDPVVASGLAVGYDGAAVVSGLDLRLRPGEVLCVMGTNGCGKSTLLKTMAGLLAPVDGMLTVLGHPPPGPPRRIAYLSQHPATVTALPMRARDVVAMGRFAHLGHLGRATTIDRDAVADAMRRLDIADLAERSMQQLSGGQRQRTHLAQAIARGAALLLVDEPTAGLDPTSRARWNQIVAEERRAGTAVVMASHDLADAEIADQVLLLAHRVIASGPPDQVLTDANLRACYGFTEAH